MSKVETTKTTKTEQFTNWKEQPLEIKIMDLASIAWIAIGLINVIFSFFIDLNIRTFPSFFLPLFLFVLTISLRLRLNDKPETLRNTFITWFSIFIVTTIVCILVMILYPGIN